MRKSRISLISLLAIALLASLVFALSSCGGSEITEIYVEKSNMPRTTYVEGQDLDLSGGAITTVADGVKALVAMDGENVTVSSFDKNKVGKQTVTLTYMGQSTTIELTVLPRMTLEGFEANYFKGDAFDATKGKVKITRDDTTTFTVNMSDKTISVLSYDFSSAGTQTVKIKYTGTDGKSYEGSFNVTVHEIKEVTFTPPTKKNYQSHDTVMDFTGGYFTVKAAESTGFKKFVNLNMNMVSGFNPSLATILNSSEPLEQTVVFSYGGVDSEFSIKVKFSNLSSVLYYANEISDDINWADVSIENITAWEDDGRAAFEAVKAYLALTSSEKSAVSEEIINKFICPAFIYTTYLYQNEILTLDGAILLQKDGSFFLNPKNYEQACEVLDRLNNSDDPLNAYADVLRKMKSQLGDKVIFDEYKISDVIIINDEKNVLDSVEILSYMTGIYDYVKDLPSNFTVEDLKTNSEDLSRMLTTISVSKYSGINYFSLYRTISNWRENNDLLEIAYSYCCYADENGAATINKIFHKLPLPGELDAWYTWLYQGAYEVQYIEYNINNSGVVLYDMTKFMSCYYNALSASVAVKNSESQLVVDLYALMGGDTVLETALRNVSYGYIFNMGSAFGNKAVEDVWTLYVNLFTVSDDGEMTPDEFSGKIKVLFDSFVELTPSEQNAFLSSLHFLYNSIGGQVLVLDCKEGAKGLFAFIIANYYLDKFSENGKYIFYDVLLATENYSLKNLKPTAIEDFKAAMANIISGKATLSDADKEAFDTYLGAWYEKYNAIYESITQKPALSDEDKAKLDELYDAILDFDRVYSFILGIGDKPTPEEQAAANAAFPVVIALYERCRNLYEDIIYGDNEALRLALISSEVTYDEFEVTIDRLYNNARGLFVKIMVSTPMNSGNTVYLAWDIYAKCDLPDFYALIAELLLSGFEGTLYEGDLASILAMFDSLDLNTKNHFFFFGTQNTYYAALEAYFNSNLSEELVASNIVRAILNTQYYNCARIISGIDEQKTAFVSSVETAKALYDALEDTSVLPEALRAIFEASLEDYEALNS